MSYLKFITGHKDAVTSLFEDVGKNNVVCYDVEKFPGSGFSSFFPKPYLDKCSCVTVATSGDAAWSRLDGGFAIPNRSFRQRRAKSYDFDPFVATLDSDTGSPTETGIVAYHQAFRDRTTPITDYDHLTKPETIMALRQQLTTGSYPISGAEQSVAQALHHMADLFSEDSLMEWPAIVHVLLAAKLS